MRAKRRDEVMKTWFNKSWVRDTVTILQISAMMAIPTALLLTHVSNQYKITELGYQIAQVTSEHRGLLEENKKLTVEARVQGRSDRMAQMARRDFGLVEARPEQIITVELKDPTETTVAAGELARAD